MTTISSLGIDILIPFKLCSLAPVISILGSLRIFNPPYNIISLTFYTVILIYPYPLKIIYLLATLVFIYFCHVILHIETGVRDLTFRKGRNKWLEV